MSPAVPDRSPRRPGRVRAPAPNKNPPADGFPKQKRCPSVRLSQPGQVLGKFGQKKKPHGLQRVRQPIAGERGGWLRGVPAETAGSEGPDAAGPAPPRRSPPLIIAGEARTPRTPLGTLSRGILSWARNSQALRGVPGREGSSPPLPQTSCTTTNLTPVASGALIFIRNSSICLLISSIR